jgi:hypothetical protein
LKGIGWDKAALRCRPLALEHDRNNSHSKQASFAKKNIGVHALELLCRILHYKKTILSKQTKLLEWEVAAVRKEVLVVEWSVAQLRWDQLASNCIAK